MARLLRVGYGCSLALVVIAILAVLTLVTWLMLPRIAAQVDELAARLPTASETVRRYLDQYRWGKAITTQMELGRLLPSRSDIVAQITGIASSTLNSIANLFIILFVGLYGAVGPQTYVDGLVCLFPLRRRSRVRQILAAIDQTLVWWLVGRLCSMVVIGAGTALGLWLLGVPLALTLGMIAAVLGFIPYVGPILAGLPAVLIGLKQGPQQAWPVLTLYVGLQTVESYLLTPLVQQRAIALPPAFQLATQVLAGVLFGLMGLALATPLSAAGLVVVRIAYIEDVLGDFWEHSADEQEPT